MQNCCVDDTIFSCNDFVARNTLFLPFFSPYPFFIKKFNYFIKMKIFCRHRSVGMNIVLSLFGGFQAVRARMRTRALCCDNIFYKNIFMNFRLK